MKQLDSDLWVADQSLRIAGLELGARMTVVRLTDGGLWLHSPIRPTPELLRDVGALGRVAALVAPNRFHHLFVAQWMEAFPDASVFVAPGLQTKRPDLAAAQVLTDEAPALWKGTLEQVQLGGLPMTNEVVFFHPSSRTLIATDLAFHIGEERPLLTRLSFRLSGAYRRLAPTLLERLLVRDRGAFVPSLQRILQWPFERVIVAHGTVLEKGGRRQLADGYAWILPSS